MSGTDAFEKYGLRDYQSESCKEIMDKFGSMRNLPLILVMPTGTGKTLTALAACLELYNNKEKYGINRIVWVAHKQELTDQAEDTLYNKLNVPNMHTVFYFDKLSEFRKKVIGLTPNDLVVYDEAHHCITDNKTYCLEEVKRSGAMILGLTATPFRTDERSRTFVDIFTQREGVDHNLYRRTEKAIIEKITLSMAIAKGYLTGFQLYDISFDSVWKSYNEKNGGCWEEIYKKEVIRKVKNIILENYESEDRPKKRPDNGKILVFCRENADDIYEELKASKISVGMLVDSKYKYYCGMTGSGEEGNTPDLRRNIINRFSKEDSQAESLKVLINNQILTEGFDEPKVSDIILMYDTDSFIKMTQIIGRGLRLSGNDNERDCAVFNFPNSDVCRKLYDGQAGKYSLRKQKMIHEAFSELFIIDNEDNIYTHVGRVGDDQVKNAYQAKAIYEFVSAFPQTDDNAEAAGVIIQDGFIEYIITKKELELYIDVKEREKLDTEVLFKLYFDRVINDKRVAPIRVEELYSIINSAYKKFIEISDNRDNSIEFKNYLESRGIYREYSDEEQKDIDKIRKHCLDKIETIIKGSVEYKKEKPETIIRKYCDEEAGIREIEFYKAELMKRIMRL